MAIIKCKMCGGDLNITEGESVCECEYCGSRQTVPTADNEKKMTLFSRASRLLRNCEFDKAASVFENIVADFPEEGEAYWCLLLCKYGIEYVDDPNTGKKIPTCHRSSFESVLDDSNFEQACENADAVARRVYRDEARAIEELRKGIIEVSGKEEPYDVFISYKETDENGDRTLDSVIAQDIYKELTNEGYRVFFSRISLEGKLGVEYEPYIFAALNSAKVMIVVGSDYENFDAVWVKNEWSRFLKLIAAGQKKTLIPVFKNMDAYDMPKEFAKLSAQDMGKVGSMQDLVRGVEKLISRKNAGKGDAPTQQAMDIQIGGISVRAMVKRGEQALEDGEWEKADQFFDQALNMDAECAEAFLGKFCASEKAETLEEALDQRFSALCEEAKTITDTIPEADEQIKRIVSEYQVPNYYSAEIIKNSLEYRRDYTANSQFWSQASKEQREQLNKNRLLARATKYANGGNKQTIEKSISTFEKKLEEAVNSSIEEEKAAKNLLQEEYAAFLKQQEMKIAEESKAAKIKLEKQKAKDKARKEVADLKIQYGINVKEYTEIVSKLEQLKKIADNALHEKERAEEALRSFREEYDGLHGMFTGKRREILEDTIMRQGRYLKEKEEKANAAMAEYQRVLDLKPEKPDEQELIYVIAGKLYDAEIFSEAITEYEKICGYKDVDSLLSEEEELRESIYQKGCLDQSNASTIGEYEAAIASFERVRGYKDSYIRIEQCQRKIQDFERKGINK